MSPSAPTVAGDRGYLAPLRRGLFFAPETARIGRKHSRVPVNGTLLILAYLP